MKKKCSSSFEKAKTKIFYLNDGESLFILNPGNRVPFMQQCDRVEHQQPPNPTCKRVHHQHYNSLPAAMLRPVRVLRHGRLSAAAHECLIGIFPSSRTACRLGLTKRRAQQNSTRSGFFPLNRVEMFEFQPPKIASPSSRKKVFFELIFT